MQGYLNKPIKEWTLEERPREKMIARGINALTDAELIAILIGTGTRKANAIDLAHQLIKEFGDLSRLCMAGINDLQKIKGIGTVKAIILVASFELSRRKSSENCRPEKITHSKIAADYLTPKMADLPHEECHMLCLDRANQIKAERPLSVGGLSSTIIDPRIVFKEALGYLSSSIVVAHNHPSGNPVPSEQDKAITKKLKECGELLDIKLLDHLIITRNGYYSFADNGFI